MNLLRGVENFLFWDNAPQLKPVGLESLNYTIELVIAKMGGKKDFTTFF